MHTPSLFRPLILIACSCLFSGCTGSSSDQETATPLGDNAQETVLDESLQMDAAWETSTTPPKLGPDGYPLPETWQAANERQAQRAVRSFAQLRKRNVPAYDGPLFVADDEVAVFQSAQDVAKRTMVLWAVELRAEGVSKQETNDLIEKMDLWDSVSDEERKFLEAETPDPEQAQKLVWRLESIWVLLWSLGYIDTLDWPSGMCDVGQLVKVLKPLESDPTFISEAKLRSKSEILDAQDLTMRIHWAVRDAFFADEQTVPKGLDWTNTESVIPIAISPAVGVVEQRHYVLNWIVRYLNPKNWDSVDTPT